MVLNKTRLYVLLILIILTPIFSTNLSQAAKTISAQIKDFTDTRTKAVWAQATKDNSGDVFCTLPAFTLVGIDTDDGRGTRKILGKIGNYKKPLITPDGETIIYTDLHRKAIYAVDWNGKNLTRIYNNAFALDTWQDTKTKEIWVIATGANNVLDTQSEKSVFKFKLQNPKVKQKLIGNIPPNTIGIDATQISPNGQTLTTTFPWPKTGIINLKEKKFTLFENGCWPSIAKDGSPIMWIFDGQHRNLSIFDFSGKKLNFININTHPHLKGHEVYHPVWSNNVQFSTMTGPYIKGFEGNAPVRKTYISVGGEKVEVFIGKFNHEINKVIGMLRLTFNQKADFYPALWLANGEKTKSVHFGKTLKPPTEIVENLTNNWPPKINNNQLIFLWKNLKASNQIEPTKSEPEKFTQTCNLIPKKFARYGPLLGIRLDGGYATLDELSTSELSQTLSTKENSFSLEFTMTPFETTKTSKAILTLPTKPKIKFSQRGNNYVLSWFTNEVAYPLKTYDQPINPSEPIHFIIAWDKSTQILKIIKNGEIEYRAHFDNLTHDGNSKLELGDKENSWNGSIRGLAIRAGNFDDNYAKLCYKAFSQSTLSQNYPPLNKISFIGMVKKVSPIPEIASIAPYKRALISVEYQVDKIYHGELNSETANVVQWVILDSQYIHKIPKPGMRELVIASCFEDNPQLVGEYFDYQIPLDSKIFFNTKTPQ